MDKLLAKGGKSVSASYLSMIWVVNMTAVKHLDEFRDHYGLV